MKDFKDETVPGKLDRMIEFLEKWNENITIVPEDKKYLIEIKDLIEKQQKEISLLKDQLEYVKSEYEETIEHQQKEIEDWKFTAKYVEENYISKDKIKPIQIIDLDGKIHNVYKIEEE